jgi:hypothetical protein
LSAFYLSYLPEKKNEIIKHLRNYYENDLYEIIVKIINFFHYQNNF